jgi:hypothetical protein
MENGFERLDHVGSMIDSYRSVIETVGKDMLTVTGADGKKISY